MHVVLRTIPKKGLSCLFGRIDRKKKKKKKRKKKPMQIKKYKVHYISILRNYYWHYI